MELFLAELDKAQKYLIISSYRSSLSVILVVANWNFTLLRCTASGNLFHQKKAVSARISADHENCNFCLKIFNIFRNKLMHNSKHHGAGFHAWLKLICLIVWYEKPSYHLYIQSLLQIIVVKRFFILKTLDLHYYCLLFWNFLFIRAYILRNLVEKGNIKGF